MTIIFLFFCIPFVSSLFLLLFDWEHKTIPAKNGLLGEPNREGTPLLRVPSKIKNSKTKILKQTNSNFENTILPSLKLDHKYNANVIEYISFLILTIFNP